MNAAISIVPLTLLLAAALARAEIKDAVVDSPDPDVISIQGIITPQTARQFQSLLRSSTRKVMVSSEGGVTEAALDIAEHIQKRRIDVEVVDVCASSCANYIFIAGAGKVIREGGVVGWHGGHSFKPFRARTESRERLIEKEAILLREQLLYARAGISIDLIVYSGLLTLGSYVDGKVDREYTLWVPDAVELRRLGVQGLTGATTGRSAAEINARLDQMGFGGQSVYVGGAYTYLPSVVSSQQDPTVSGLAK
jgi:hypothetical protein